MAGYKKMAHENGSKSETQNGNPNRNLHEKINPEYYQLLSKAARHITVLPSETARTAMEALKAQGGFAQMEVYEDCWHVFQQMPIPRATRALESASRFVQRIL